MSISADQVVAQYPPKFSRGAQLGFYLALLAGALFWGGTADIIGRKWAFNFSLLISAIFAITAGAAPNYAAWATMVAISAFGSGGNLVLDTTVFLEYLPSNKQWLLTLLAGWWGVGQTVAGLVAWPFMGDYSPPTPSHFSCANRKDQRTIVAPSTAQSHVRMLITWDGDTCFTHAEPLSLS